MHAHMNTSQVVVILPCSKVLHFGKTIRAHLLDRALIRRVSDPPGALPSPKRHAADLSHHYSPRAAAKPTRVCPKVFTSRLAWTAHGDNELAGAPQLFLKP